MKSYGQMGGSMMGNQSMMGGNQSMMGGGAQSMMGGGAHSMMGGGVSSRPTLLGNSMGGTFKP